jgi:dTDP-4-amino-4,6-dideoxygalactose transaminase
MKSERVVKFVNLGLQYESMREEILSRIDDISRRGDYILGKEVTLFEERFAEYCGSRYALGVGNGSDALFFLLKAYGIGAGDEVITAPNSFIASAWVIAHTGARIVFADVGEDYNIDPVKIEKAITAKTKAILPVHLTGRCADMNAIRAIAQAHRLRIIEDAAQSVGASYHGRKTGSLGDGAGFSLHPLKNLHVLGDGGVLTTSDSTVYEQIKMMRNHGLKNRDECSFWGYNSRLDTLQASIALLKLSRLDVLNERFRFLAKRYSAALRGHVTIPVETEGYLQVYHRYVIRHPRRDELQAFLASRGIETKVNYPIPLHLQEAAKDLGYRRGDFPVAEKLAGEILSLPIYAELDDDSVDYVIENILQFCK